MNKQAARYINRLNAQADIVNEGQTKTVDVAAARWGIAYHSNNHSPRAKKWYRVSRLVYADGDWFELYWHAEINLRGDNIKVIQRKAREYGLSLLPGLFHDKRPPSRGGSEMERVL